MNQTSGKFQFDVNDLKSTGRVFLFGLVAVVLQYALVNVGKVNFGVYGVYVVPVLITLIKAVQRLVAE